MSGPVKLERAFLAWARSTYRWERGDVARLQRERPEVLAGIQRYWEACYGKGAK